MFSGEGFCVKQAGTFIVAKVDINPLKAVIRSLNKLADWFG